ncbi:MAG: hypothetical protein H6Q52_2211 [Deltaproteobacteria bacterium]|nr:hypothetical protein [Deltaproteobacteria bacterium]
MKTFKPYVEAALKQNISHAVVVETSKVVTAPWVRMKCQFGCSGKTIDQFNETLVDLERSIFLDGYYKAWSLGCGPCDRCAECNTGGTCLHSDRARPSMEGCGIDVFKTVREKGLPINVLKNREEERNAYGLILIE